MARDLDASAPGGMRQHFANLTLSGYADAGSTRRPSAAPVLSSTVKIALGQEP
jgi:hypothetical protein